MKIKQFFTGILALGFLFTACNDDDNKTESTSDVDALKSAVKTTYADIAYANYSDALNTAEELKTAIYEFVANPSTSTLAEAKLAWLTAREPYGQTEAFRFSGGPIDDADGPEGLLNAWPLNEAYIDYVSGDANSGIINDLINFPTISAQVLEDANEVGGEENVAVGYHAIEFLLWGQDDPDEALLAGGTRPYTDYTTAPNATRRGEVLKHCADQLIVHLTSLKNEWDASGSSNFRSEFLALSNNDALKLVLSGMGILSKAELAGERMYVAVDNQDQEDEHSCFSDNTHRDIILNAQGIRNIYTGSYTKVDGSVVEGTSIEDVIEAINGTLAQEMSDLSMETMANVNDIPVPFDYHLKQETVTGNGPIMTAVLSLQAQGDKIAAVASALGISISVALPD